MTSIRLRLVVPLVVGLALLLAIGGVVLHRAVHMILRDGLDAALVEKARALASRLTLEIDPDARIEAERLGAALFDALERGEDDQEVERARADLLQLAETAFVVGFVAESPGAERTDTVFRIEDGRGRLVVVSGEAGRDLVGGSPAEGETEIRDCRLRDGRRGRVVSLLVGEVAFADPRWQGAWERMRGPGGVAPAVSVVVVAESREALDAFLGALGWGLLAFGFLFLVACGLVVRRVVARGLAPLDDLGSQIEALDPALLARRVELATTPLELTEIVAGLNEALEALEAAFARERRTTANIAHELRTPIAELRSLTEIALQWPDDEALTKQAVDQAHEVSLHMSQIVTSLLQIARAASGGGGRATERIELREFVRATWERFTARADERGLALRLEVPEDLVVFFDLEALQTILGNLLQNAVEHAPEGSPIDVAAGRDEAGAELTVANPAGDLQPEDLARVTEAFWRKDAARGPSPQGGLGLSLAAELAQAAGAELAFDLRDGVYRARIAFHGIAPGRGS